LTGGWASRCRRTKSNPSKRRVGTGVKNGALLRLAVEARFDVFITMDSSLVHQQNLAVHPIAVLVLRAPSNQIEDTSPLMPKVLQALPTAPKGKRTLIEN
jgi:hypothetical protein